MIYSMQVLKYLYTTIGISLGKIRSQLQERFSHKTKKKEIQRYPEKFNLKAEKY